MAEIIEKLDNLDHGDFISLVLEAIEKSNSTPVSLTDIRSYLKRKALYNDEELGEALSNLVSRELIRPTHIQLTPTGDAFTALFLAKKKKTKYSRREHLKQVQTGDY